MKRYIILISLFILVILSLKTPIGRFVAQDDCLDRGSVWEYSFDRCYSDNSEVLEFALLSETYIQDGYNMSLVNIEKVHGCKKCSKYNFIFNRYGDPGITYQVSVFIRDKVMSFN